MERTGGIEVNKTKAKISQIALENFNIFRLTVERAGGIEINKTKAKISQMALENFNMFRLTA